MSLVSGGILSATDVAGATLAEVEAAIATVSGTADPLRRRAVGRWSPCENLDHLRLAVRPVSLALALPSFALRIFGKPRVHRSYEQVVETYQQRLAEGAKAMAPFVPPRLAPDTDADRLKAGLRAAYATYAARLLATRPEALDSILLPHPILGRLTLREMAFFTLYHVRHHHAAIRRDAGLE